MLFYLCSLFALCQCPVLSKTVVNADNGEALFNYEVNSGVGLASLSIDDVSNVSLRFNTSNANSVRISGVTPSPRVESHKPFSLLGDVDEVYQVWSPGVGVHRITVTPFANFSGFGDQGTEAILIITIRETGDELDPITDIDEPIVSDPDSPGPSDLASVAGRVAPVIALLLNEEAGAVQEEREVVIMMGSSIVEQPFGQDLTQTNSQVMARLAENGVNNIDFYGYGFSGQTVGGILPAVSNALEVFPQAHIVIMIGGNDVTRDRAYASRTAEQAANFTRDLDNLVARFEGIEDQLFLVPLTYSSYNEPQMFEDGSRGVEPFNVYEYLPRIPESQLNVDGNPVLDMFNFTRNNRITLGSDGIHFNRFGLDQQRLFIADRIPYLINGGEIPDIVVPGAPPEPLNLDLL